MNLHRRLASLEDAFVAGVDYDSWPLGEQILAAIAPVRARICEGVRGVYYATDRELAILAAASRYA